MAALDDIRRLRDVMQEVTDMELELGRLGSAVSGRSIELKSSLKRRLSAPTMLEVMNPAGAEDGGVDIGGSLFRDKLN